MSAIPDKQWCEDYRICKKIEKKKEKKKLSTVHRGSSSQVFSQSAEDYVTS